MHTWDRKRSIERFFVVYFIFQLLYKLDLKAFYICT